VRHNLQRRCTVRRERRRHADDVAHEHLIERIRRVPELEAQLAIERDLGVIEPAQRLVCDGQLQAVRAFEPLRHGDAAHRCA
jgi:hypothetical protein